jgi:hypothetical protein
MQTEQLKLFKTQQTSPYSRIYFETAGQFRRESGNKYPYGNELIFYDND